MTLEARIPDIATGATLGGLACAGAIYLGPTVLSSGWTSVACGALLGASAVTLVAKRYVDERSERMARASKADPASHPRLMLGASAKPAEWLADVPAVSPETRAHLIRAKLSECLSPLAGRPPGGEQPFADFSDMGVALLAVAIASHAVAAENGRLARRILAELDAAHILTEGARHEALERLRASLHAHLAPDGKVLKHYATYRERHGTRETLMFAMLLHARKRRGVLAIAEFLWLKGVDRGLWYALANAGRRTYLVEGLAAVDHFHHEMVEGRPSRDPCVDNAVAALMAVPEATAQTEPEAA